MFFMFRGFSWFIPTDFHHHFSDQWMKALYKYVSNCSHPSANCCSFNYAKWQTKPNPIANNPKQTFLLWFIFHKQNNWWECTSSLDTFTYTVTSLFASTISAFTLQCVYHAVHLGRREHRSWWIKEKEVVSVCFQVKSLWLQWECNSTPNEPNCRKWTKHAVYFGLLAQFFRWALNWCVRCSRAVVLQCENNVIRIFGTKGKKEKLDTIHSVLNKLFYQTKWQMYQKC